MAQRKRQASNDEIVEDLEQIVKDIQVPPEKQSWALGILRIFIVKKMSQAQVRGTRIAKEELKKERNP